MKVIDLLNKIANGEEVPKKIIYKNNIWVYKQRRDTDYFNYICDGEYLSQAYFLDNILNNEIKIIEEEPRDIEICGSLFTKSEYDKLAHSEEEKKIPEKIKSNGKEFYCDNIDSWIDKEKTSAYCEYLMNKYNDLIDYLKSKGDE